MPAIHGGVSEELEELFYDEMIDNGRFDDQSDAVEHCVEYTLANKYNATVDD